MKTLLRFLLALLLLPNCSFIKAEEKAKEIQQTEVINKEGKTIAERFLAPKGYTRTASASNSFGLYLQSLPLKPIDSKVKYYNGETKSNHNVYEAVIDLAIGKKDLHQCADAVMRLRAEHLFEQKQYDQIHFNFTNGFNVAYSKYRAGNRMLVKGNKT